MIWFIYFNGDFYYPSQDNHYKHGRSVAWEGSENDARRVCDEFNAKIGV